MKAAIYARVSAIDQDCEIQLTNLRQVAKGWGWEAEEYVEKLSGKEGNKRPQLERLLQDARMKQFGVVLVWKLDRFGRSTLDTLNNIKALDSYGVRFLCPSQAIDTDQQNPFAKFFMQMLAAVAELERSMINERTKLGFQAYQAAFKAGKVGTLRHSKSGKDLPIGRPRLVVDRRKVRRLAEKGQSIREIAKTVGVSKSAIARILK
jgi:site-specific DNA recombinase